MTGGSASDDIALFKRLHGEASVGRCFVVDPVCAFDFGHSLNSLNYFTKLARSRWDEVAAVASYHLPVSDDRSDGIDRFFDFYYDRFIKIERRNIKYNGISMPPPGDPKKRALADYSDFFFYRGIGPRDSIVLPNTDIYSLLSVLTVLNGLPVTSAPDVYLRFIGVMEHAKYFERDRLDIATAQIRDLKKRGYHIAISAETSTLARSMMKQLGSNVYTTPYPLVGGDVLPLPDGPFTILCGGSARADKGFSRLPGIINHVNAISDTKTHFLVQNAPPAEQIKHLPTIIELSKMKNVTLLDGVLPFSKIMDAYARTSLSIMPYDPAVYAERGSAILMESIMFGRLVVGQADTAFSEQILLYNSGEVARSDEEFARAIVRLSTMAKQYLEQQALAARHRYINDVESSYQGWLGGRA